MFVYRTVPQAFSMIKDMDPDTAITISLLRKLIKTGVIPSLPNGNRPLVKVDDISKSIDNYMAEYSEKIKSVINDFSEKDNKAPVSSTKKSCKKVEFTVPVNHGYGTLRQVSKGA